MVDDNDVLEEEEAGEEPMMGRERTLGMVDLDVGLMKTFHLGLGEFSLGEKKTDGLR